MCTLALCVCASSSLSLSPSPPPLSPSFLQLTEGYSGSDIQLVCKEAAMISLRKVFDSLESMNKGKRYTVENVNSI